MYKYQKVPNLITEEYPVAEPLDMDWPGKGQQLFLAQTRRNQPCFNCGLVTRPCTACDVVGYGFNGHRQRTYTTRCLPCSGILPPSLKIKYLQATKRTNEIFCHFCIVQSEPENQLSALLSCVTTFNLSNHVPTPPNTKPTTAYHTADTADMFSQSFVLPVVLGNMGY